MIQDKTYSPVFITGVERSGSSVVGRIISMCGAFSGEVTGMCENVRIKKYVDTFYTKIGADPKGQYPLPNTSLLPIPSNWGQWMENSIRKEGYEGGEQVWMYKSSRISQLWPIWNYAYPNAKWIVVRRRTGDVIQSCLKTGFMDAFGDRTVQQLVGVDTERDGWLWWVKEHEKLFVEMINTGLNVKVIWPERMLDGNFEQIHEMLDWLGLPWKVGIISLLEETLIKTNKDGSKSYSNAG
jgi:hypothetical protein